MIDQCRKESRTYHVKAGRETLRAEQVYDHFIDRRLALQIGLAILEKKKLFLRFCMYKIMDLGFGC